MEENAKCQTFYNRVITKEAKKKASLSKEESKT